LRARRTDNTQLTELNRVYLETLTNWTKESLNSQYSAQVVYNLPMDMLANIPAVNGPECESLGFNHVIDAYRQFAGPANLAGKRVISSELGAQRNEAYSQTMPELIWDVKRSIVGSINNFVSPKILVQSAVYHTANGISTRSITDTPSRVHTQTRLGQAIPLSRTVSPTCTAHDSRHGSTTMTT
jgi:hypothetical protein